MIILIPQGNNRLIPLIRLDETWIRINTIHGYEHFLPIYWISSHGRIYSENIGFMTQTQSLGYLYISIFNKYKTNSRLRVHRLVLKGFNYITGCEYMEVNHIDGNKTNNHLSNLEWTTRKENMDHAVANNLAVSCEDSYRATITNDQAKMVCKLLSTGEYSTSEIANMLNISKYVVDSIYNRGSWTQISKDYIFEKKILRIFTNSQLRLIVKYMKEVPIPDGYPKEAYYRDIVNDILGLCTTNREYRSTIENIFNNVELYIDKLNNCKH